MLELKNLYSKVNNFEFYYILSKNYFHRLLYLKNNLWGLPWWLSG